MNLYDRILKKGEEIGKLKAQQKINEMWKQVRLEEKQEFTGEIQEAIKVKQKWEQQRIKAIKYFTELGFTDTKIAQAFNTSESYVKTLTN